jgi:biopolymer transport protein ExbD
MAFASSGGGGPLADINVTPLVDVMLVLLIIFMVTMPIQSFPIKVDLPQKTDKPLENPKEPPEPIRLRIDASNQVYWNDSPTPLTALQNMMKAEVDRDPSNQPTLEIDANDDAEYDVLAKVLAAAKNAEMIKIGFVQNSQ